MLTLISIVVTLTFIGMILEGIMQEKQEEESWDSCDCAMCRKVSD
jgi:hypothetical protein